jgi:hypothetical protein
MSTALVLRGARADAGAEPVARLAGSRLEAHWEQRAWFSSSDVAAPDCRSLSGTRTPHVWQK